MMKFSQNYKAVQSRIKRLPVLVEGVADAQRKRDANALLAYWREGIQSGSLQLKPLKPRTISRKAKLGYSQPNTPLYGIGLDGKDSYIKGMRVFRKKKGWAVRMMDKRHHTSKLPLTALFIVHEYGTIINTKNATILIPPRPAMAKAYQMVLRDIKKNDPNKEMAKAVNQFIRSGNRAMMDRVKKLADEMEAMNV